MGDIINDTIKDTLERRVTIEVVANGYLILYGYQQYVFTTLSDALHFIRENIRRVND